MRVPIEYALLYPDRADLGIPRFDILAQQTPLTFAAPDEDRFPAWAWHAARPKSAALCPP